MEPRPDGLLSFVELAMRTANYPINTCLCIYQSMLYLHMEVYIAAHILSSISIHDLLCLFLITLFLLRLSKCTLNIHNDELKDGGTASPSNAQIIAKTGNFSDMQRLSVCQKSRKFQGCTNDTAKYFSKFNDIDHKVFNRMYF